MFRELKDATNSLSSRSHFYRFRPFWRSRYGNDSESGNLQSFLNYIRSLHFSSVLRFPRILFSSTDYFSCARVTHVIDLSMWTLTELLLIGSILVSLLLFLAVVNTTDVLWSYRINDMRYLLSVIRTITSSR